MRLTAKLFLLGLASLCVGAYAQEANLPSGQDGAKPARLTTEMRKKLTEARAKVSSDAQYEALLKAARQAQDKADDYFMAKLQQAVAEDEKLARYVADLIKQEKSRRATSATTSAAE